MINELMVQCNSQKSYYGKAVVGCKYYEDYKQYTLYSYNTTVAHIRVFYDDRPKKLFILGFYSATTLRHIKDFVYQYYDGIKHTKSELELI